MNPIIDIQDLHKSYQNDSVLNGFNLQIQEGCSYGFLGRNGAGKTTAIKVIMGLTHYEKGNVKVLGQDPTQMETTIKAQIGYVSQNAILPNHFSVQDCLNFHEKIYPNWQKSYVEKLIQDFDIKKNKNIRSLSGGTQQLVSLILALGINPKLLILDEPAIGLDPISKQEFMDQLIDILIQEERTIFFSSHILTDVEKIASHVAILKKGKLFLDMELDTLKTNVKQVQVNAPTETKLKLNLPNLVSIRKFGSEHVLTFRDFDENTLQKIKQQTKAELKVLDMNFEEIFIELVK